MTSDAYLTVLQMAGELPLEEQLQLLEELVTFIRHGIQTPRKHSITELRGLGKDTWEGIDVEKYINDERNSWDRQFLSIGA
jgi:hypothetical protein